MERKKEDASNWLLSELNKYDLSSKRILSIGAGTGIIEMPLIEKGIKIDLYDVQSDSFVITGVNKKAICYTGDISKIPQKYDALVSIAACYTLSDTQITAFFRNSSNLLKENGLFIILDTSLSWYEIYSWVRNRKYFLDNYLLWGAKRSINNIMKYAKPYFSLRFFNFYGDKMLPLDVIKFSGVPFNATPTWQSLILEKNKKND